MLAKAFYICWIPKMAGMKKNILLVDDDKIFNFLSEKTITSLGLANEISFASNGQQALELLEMYKSGKMHMPDIIFLDLDMPIMNGYEFLEEFARIDLPNKNAITIVVLTSSADPRDLARTKELGIKYYYNKPLSREEIKKLIGQEFSIPLN
jgi:CheY-like chemotaxis protein